MSSTSIFVLFAASGDRALRARQCVVCIEVLPGLAAKTYYYSITITITITKEIRDCPPKPHFNGILESFETSKGSILVRASFTLLGAIVRWQVPQMSRLDLGRYSANFTVAFNSVLAAL